LSNNININNTQERKIIIPKGFTYIGNNNQNQGNKKLNPIQLINKNININLFDKNRKINNKNINIGMGIGITLDPIEKLNTNMNTSTNEFNKIKYSDSIYNNKKNISMSTIKINNSLNNNTNNNEIEFREDANTLMNNSQFSAFDNNNDYNNFNENKESNLEKIYKQAINKNFRNLEKDLIDYYENFKGFGISEEINKIKNKYFFLNFSFINFFLGILKVC